MEKPMKPGEYVYAFAILLVHHEMGGESRLLARDGTSTVRNERGAWTGPEEADAQALIDRMVRANDPLLATYSALPISILTRSLDALVDDLMVDPVPRSIRELAGYLERHPELISASDEPRMRTGQETFLRLEAGRLWLINEDGEEHFVPLACAGTGASEIGVEFRDTGFVVTFRHVTIRYTYAAMEGRLIEP